MAIAKKKEPKHTVQDFLIVGVGASAGGLDAFQSLIKAIPEKTGMAYVFVQHLSPKHESILPEILQRVTNIPVFEITADINLAPDNIYIIPSNKILSTFDGILKLRPRQKDVHLLSIDIFFTSLAQVHKENAVGVVLSGTGSDGTQGLKAIKENGGITFAQELNSAAYDGMPKSAIDSGVVDFVLTPDKIPGELVGIEKSFNKSHVFKGSGKILKADDDTFNQIITLLHKRSGVDFSFYKQPTFHRRIARRISINKKKNIADYLKYLKTDKDEQDALFQDVLIPVTSFFRDPKTFQSLTDKVFPVLFKNKESDDPIRVWIAGCSTGQEAFSIAISLHEFLGDKLSNIKIQIFASDISEKAIKIARTGIYSKADVEKLSEERVKKYFVKNEKGYEVRKLIRDTCVFAPHNFLKDPPFAKMDLISCRNALIYMDTFLQKKALTVFHYALKENAFLLLGKSESTSPASELFTVVDKQEKIYSRKSVPGRFIHVVTERKENTIISNDKVAPKEESIQTDFRKNAESILLSKYTPGSVVVNEQMDIVHIHGVISPFLEAPQGKPTYNLIKMAHEGLAFELRNGLHKVNTSGEKFVKEDILIKVSLPESDHVKKSNEYLVKIEIIPLANTVESYYLVLFTKTPLLIVDEKDDNKSPHILKIEVVQKRNAQLEKELSRTHEDMRSITESMEAANEELQSANEELQSSNEEMQSLNEELETSKEELQSTNEELTIVNLELSDKQDQLNEARIYAESIVTTIREPLIVLDSALKIKTANNAFYKKFNTNSEKTEGRFFYDIQDHLWNNKKMSSLLENILLKKERLEDFEISIKFPLIGERNLLLNATKIVDTAKNDQLILLAIDDITDRKLIADELIKTKNQAEKATETAENALKVKQQFLSNMSHDIHTPLNAIIDYTTLLMNSDLSLKDTENVEAIKISSEALIVLMNDILNLAKVNDRKIKFEKLPFKLESSLSAILHLFEIKITEKKIKFVKVYDKKIPEILIGDSARLFQIILILMSNSLKFTSKGKITLEVKLFKETPTEASIQFIVTDTGIGITDSEIEHVFENFQSTSNTTSNLFGETGLGLAIVKQLVEKQGGTVTVKSKIDVGSTFSFTLNFQKITEEKTK